MEKLTNRILLIDDTTDNLEILSDLIQHAFPGYVTMTASSGMKGLVLAGSADPDVILLDVVMPGMNGFEVCQKLKSDPKTSLIPVVFLTAVKGDWQARVQAIEVGAEAFLSRPVDESELIAQIRAMQKIKRAALLLQDEKENLTNLVALQTQALQQAHTATLNLLEDLHTENEARKKNEAALFESEQRFRTLIEKAPVGINISRNGIGVYANQKDLEMFGLSGVEEMIGRPVVEFFAPQARTDSLERTHRRALGLPTPAEFETIAMRPDGSQFPVHVMVDSAQLSDGPANLAFITDISERKNAQALQNAVYQIAAAAENSHSLEELYPQIHQCISSVMPAENFYIALYDEVKNLLQFPYYHDIVDAPFATDIHPGQGLTAYVLRTGKSLLGTLAQRHELERQGEVQVQGTISAIWLGVPLIIEGKTIGAMVVQHYSDPQAYGEREQHILEYVSTQVATAITRKRAEEALHESNEMLSAFVNHSPIYAYIKEVSPTQSRVLIASENFQEIIGIPGSKMVGKSMPELFPADFATKIGADDWAVASGSKVLRLDEDLNGRFYTTLKFPLALGGKILLAGYTIDITDRKQMEEALRLRESYQSAILENQPGLVWLKDADGRFQAVNRAFAISCGKASPEELTGKTDFDIWPKQFAEKYRADDARVMAEKTPVFVEELILDRGKSTWFETFKTPVLDEHSKVIGTTGFSLDITERKQAQALQQAVYQIAAAAETTSSLDELYSQIHQSISSVMQAENFYIALYDEAQNLLHFPYFKDPKDESFVGGVHPGKGTTAYVLRTGKSLLCTQARHAELERQGEVKLLGVPSAIWLGVPLIVEGKTIGAMVVQHYSDPQAYGEREQHMLEFVSTQVAIAIDRKQAEAALKESETRYRGLFEHSPVSLWEEDFSEVKRHIEELRKSGVTDFRAFFESHPQVLLECVDEINVLDVNAATLALMHAASKSQLIGSLQQVFRADASKDFVDEIVSISEGLTEFTWESLNYTLDGQKLTVSLKRSAAPGYENTLEKVLISVLDITERKRAEEEIKTILRTTIDGFYRVDQAGRIVEVNDAYCSMIGYSRAELLEMYVKDIEAVESGKVIKERIQRIVNTGSDRFETRHRRKDGKVIDIEASVNYLANAQGNIFCFMRDVTARKQAEDQIRQLNASLEERVDARTRELGAAQEQLVIHEKLATLGQLAGGVGHELRNPLGVINSAVYYLKLVQPDADEKIKKYHRMIEQEVNTAGRIINDLLDFGRIVSPDRQPVSVPELVQHVLTRFPAPPSIQVQLRIPARLPKIFADPLHMEQVLGNLTTNACQAMKDGKDSGKLTISASLKKDQVAIAIQDTGTGITPEAMQRLFEPLFTTKLRGIGLGLAVSKKLAEANGGRITVHSELGQGSTFTLYLPVNA